MFRRSETHCELRGSSSESMHHTKRENKKSGTIKHYIQKHVSMSDANTGLLTYLFTDMMEFKILAFKLFFVDQ